jgi:hypothetical protein
VHPCHTQAHKVTGRNTPAINKGLTPRAVPQHTTQRYTPTCAAGDRAQASAPHARSSAMACTQPPSFRRSLHSHGTASSSIFVSMISDPEASQGAGASRTRLYIRHMAYHTDAHINTTQHVRPSTGIPHPARATDERGKGVEGCAGQTHSVVPHQALARTCNKRGQSGTGRFTLLARIA